MNKIHLRLLDVAGNRMGIDRLNTLATCFPTLTGLKDLYLSYSSLTDEDLHSLNPTLAACEAMRVERI